MNRTSKRSSRSGSTLIVVLAIMVVVAAFVGAALDYSSTIERQSQRMNMLVKATEIGDGALELAFSSWRELCRETPNVPPTTSALASIPLPTQTTFPNLVGTFPTLRIGQSGTATIANYGVIAVDPQLNALTTGSTSVPPSYGPALNPAAGVSFTNETSYWYLASADVTLQAMSSTVTAKVRRVFQKQIQSPWQWAIFYNDDLEIQPGAPMTVTGWVQTNANLYTGNGTNTTFQSKVTYSKDWSVGFSPNESRYGSAATTPTFPANLPAALSIMQQPFGLDASRIFNNSNPNAISYHEIIETPITGYPDPFAGNRFYDLADVKILINNNTLTIYDSSGNVCTNSSTGADKALYTIFTSNITTGGSIQDAREGATMHTSTLNVGNASSQIAANSNLSGFHGIIYITDTSNTTSSRKAIKLTNGGVISQTTGLTIASQNAVYVQGDYNTGATGSTKPGSDSGTPAQNTVSSYTKKPCAIAADAINVLSNAWVDSNSTKGLGSLVASNTTINSAFLTGIVPSSGGNYSGGAENFPRFLEDWSSSTFTYYGSMVELYQSQQSTGIWPNAVYNPPTRQWYFDTSFMTNPPPGPNITNYVKAQWFTL